MIAAIGKNRELGLNNELLWDIPEDMKHFRSTTAGHPVIMGRKTYESIGRPLPKRTNIIITRNADYKVDGCITCTSLEDAIAEAKKHDDQEIFIIGGGQIYTQGLELSDKLYLTIVDSSFEADAFFPEYDQLFTKKESQRDSSNDEFEYSFIELCR